MSPSSRLAFLISAFLCLAAPLAAVVPPDGSSPVAAKETRHPDLYFKKAYERLSELPPETAVAAQRELDTLSISADMARLDLRSGRWGTLIVSEPLLPNPATSPRSRSEIQARVWDAFANYLTTNRSQLHIAPAELPKRGRVTVHGAGELVQIYAPRQIDGIPVRGSYLSATVRNGRLVLFGAHGWSDVAVSTEPWLTAEEAFDVARDYLTPHAVIGTWNKPELLLVPLGRGRSLEEVEVGLGTEYRLAWALRPAFLDDPGSWEALVDAHSGEILAFEDTNHYQTARQDMGGVYPLSNDGIGAEGTEQAGWPMPFDDVLTDVGTLTTDTGGNLPLCVAGDITSNLRGEFVRMNDFCGSTSLTSAGDIDFGTSGGTDCTTPGFGGAGNTHSSRTGFYELNRIKEQARGQLPANTWLQNQLTSNVNIAAACQASWNGIAVNFFCSAPGCANTGELAGVIDHEFGHGLDDNDANPTVSNPGEGIADLYAYLRLDESCIGRGFRLGVNCGGFGDPCTSCDGVRDIDYTQRASATPHDITWIDANCGTGSAPCGGGVHCEGAVYAEAVFDLINTDLPGLFGMDHNTALEVGTRLTYLGGGAVGDWYQCVTPFGGCNADGGYLNFLAADDDNANLADGTPHMSAIFAAFDRHGIACDTPAVVDSGCAGAPVAAPVVAASPNDRGVDLSWGAVAGATEYHVFRTEGVSACDHGKTKIGETTGTTFTDSGLQNGRTYYYVVLPIGPADTCIGPASTCTAATPVAGPNLSLDEDGTFTVLSVADGDPFLDNCELANLTFGVENTGTGVLNNVRIVSASSPSHPGISFVTAFPAAVSPAVLAACDSGTGSIDFIANGLAPGDTVEIVVEVTADELASSRTMSYFLELVESDFQTVASQTFSFEPDLESWEVIEGTFDRTDAGGGAELTSWYLASSDGLASQCDHVRSPLIRLSATSTLEMYTEYDIEDFCAFPLCIPSAWFDRANVGIYDVAAGTRTAVSPDGGRLYNASGSYGTCGTTGQAGWAGTEISWGASTWTAAALDSATFDGDLVQLDVRYGTDSGVQGSGFHFDHVTVTDFDLQGADTQSDVCVDQCDFDADCDDGLFCNGAETCVADVCVAGTPPCDDGVSCTADTCDEGADTCANPPSDALCDNGLFCDGVETCDAVLDCQPGTTVDCDDGVSCTVDACNEDTDVCDNTPDAAPCQNGDFCDGPEVCDPVLDCQPGTAVDCDDGVSCTVDSCDEVGDACVNSADDALCDDALFCNGAETCDAVLDCQIGPDPCTPFACDDVIDDCVGTPVAQLEAGTVEVNHLPVTINLTNAYLDPVIIATLKYEQSVLPTVTRISNVFPTRFDVVLQRPDGGPSPTETVSYLVVEEGSWTMDGLPVDAQRYLSTVTDENDSWVGEAQAYGQAFTSPVVLGQVMSTNDPDWSVFWASAASRFNPPSAAELTTGKTVCEDTDVTRLDELVGFVVLEAGNGTVNGVDYDTQVGADSIQGVGNSPPDFYNFSTPFSGAPSVGLVTMAGVDDGDGGWAQLHGATGMSAVNIFLSIDEDRIGDIERSHASEQVAYLAFAGPVLFPPAPFSDPDGDGLQNLVDQCLGNDASGDGDDDGVCADTDCDDGDANAAFADSCGVCGGDESSCGGAEQSDDPATRALWHLSDGDDAGGGGHDLVVDVSRVSFVPGRFGLAAEIGSAPAPLKGECGAGGGALTAPGSGVSYPGTGDWTLEAWIKVDDYDRTYIVISHYSEDWEGHDPYQLLIEPGGQLTFAITGGDNQTGSVTAALSSAAGEWTHVAAVYRYQERLEIYENFSLLAHQETTVVPEILTAFDVYLGGTYCETSTGLTLDDARISNFARYHGCLSDADDDGVCDDLDVCSGNDASGDSDGDGVCDDVDLCAGNDATGDSDGDGVCDNLDVCSGNDASGDSDGDGVCDDVDLCAGNDATGDSDGDGVCDDSDLCFGDNASGDSDGDGVCENVDVCLGDDAAGDSDSDGVCDDLDACPGFDDSADADADTVPDGCDLCQGDDATGDSDNDGVCDDVDFCQGDDATGDSDSDGVCDDVDFCQGDDATGDSDNDGVCNDADVCEGNDASGDSDNDGVCDDADLCQGNDAAGDSDGDGVCDDLDQCQGDDATGDSDEDGVCDNADLCQGDDATGDNDNDGVCDDSDLCFGDDATGDSDGDGICDDEDRCLGDDAAGDGDGDGVCDDLDQCQGDDAAGDSDEDGVCDDIDLCQGDDATGDSDEDGVCDDSDLCAGNDASGDSDEDGVCDDVDLCQGDDATGDSDEDGVCADIDCDDEDSGAQEADGCGVCGGDNSTCGVFFDSFESGDASGW